MQVLGMSLEWGHVITLGGSAIVGLWGYARLTSRVDQNTQQLQEQGEQLKEVRHTVANERLITSALTGRFDMMLERMASMQEDIRTLLQRKER